MKLFLSNKSGNFFTQAPWVLYENASVYCWTAGGFIGTYVKAFQNWYYINIIS